MEDGFEKKVKVYLPYVIVIAVVYLFLPSILVFTGLDQKRTALTEIIYIGIFPLTALICNMIFCMKNKNELPMTFVAPILYIPSMFLYGNIRASVLTSIIYLISYFICGFLGQVLGDILKGRTKQDTKEKRPVKRQVKRTTPERVSRYTSDRAHQTKSRTASHVSIRAREEQTIKTENTDPVSKSENVYSNSSSTEDDIDAILREIHERQKNS